MQKTLLKVLSYELFEQTARCSALLSEMTQESDSLSLAYIERLHTSLNKLKETIFSEKDFFLELFDEKSLKSREFQETFPSNISKAIETPYQQLCHLVSEALRINRLNVLPETAMFLNTSLPLSALDKSRLPAKPSILQRSVVFSATPQPLPSPFSKESIFLEQLPLLQRNNALGWLQLGNAYIAATLASGPAFSTFQKKADGQLSEPLFCNALFQHALALRLFGPAYYYHIVISAILNQDDALLIELEPTLFKDIRYEIETHGYSEEGTLTSVRTVLYGDQNSSNHTYATSASAIWDDSTNRAAALASQSVSRFRILTTIEEPFGPSITVFSLLFKFKVRSLTTL